MNILPDVILTDILRYCTEKWYREVNDQWRRIIDGIASDPINPGKMSPVWFQRIPDQIDWRHVSKNCKLSEKFIEKWASRLHWYEIFKSQVSESFIEKWVEKVDWHTISRHQRLSQSFIEKWENQVIWHIISYYQTLDEAFIDKWKDRVHWIIISRKQKISEEWIEKWADWIDWVEISHRKLSKSFTEKWAKQLKCPYCLPQTNN